MLGARADGLRRPAVRRQTVRTSGRTRATGGPPNIIGCTTVTVSRRPVLNSTRSVAVPLRTRTRCRR